MIGGTGTAAAVVFDSKSIVIENLEVSKDAQK
jgi:hypothetical protein